MEERLMEETKKKITKILDEEINPNNLEFLYKLIDIYKDAKEVKTMNYGNSYGRNMGYNSYGNYGAGYGNYGDNYGRRGVDAKYRGYDHIERMGDNYGRYMEGRERYGANSEDTKRSLEYMLRSMEDFARMLKEEASNEQEVQMIRETAQRIAQM